MTLAAAMRRGFLLFRASRPRLHSDAKPCEDRLMITKAVAPAVSAATAPSLARAEQACASAGETLTPVRRRVLELLLEANGPVKAYDLLALLKPDQSPAKPPTVYRALEFLTRLGLAHKIERENAFIACRIETSHGAQVFLLCKTCGAAAEVDAGHALHDIKQAADAIGFALADTVIEAYGQCAVCRAKAVA
jgi:Fur family zinc uptake transcriptional regulator